MKIFQKISSYIIGFVLIFSLVTADFIPVYAASGNTTVYVTNTGSKYHRYGCRYLSRSCNSISLQNAVDYGYSPCSVCDPPYLTESNATQNTNTVQPSTPTPSQSVSVQAAIDPNFDPMFYAITYPDVVDAYGFNITALYNHYITSGKSESRFPNVLGSLTISDKFDSTWYATKYPDVASATGSDPNKMYTHFVTKGFYEGRYCNSNDSTQKTLDKLRKAMMVSEWYK